MIHYILRAKNWQLFLVMFAPAMVLQFYTIGTLLAKIMSHALPLQEAMKEPVYAMIIAGLYATGGTALWMWSVGVGLQRQLPEALRLPTGIFAISLLFPICYMIYAYGFVLNILSNGFPGPTVFILIFPLHLLSMACNFYCIYFVARTFKAVELQKKPKLTEYILELLLVWLLLVGLWILQPKINAIVEQRQQFPGSA